MDKVEMIALRDTHYGGIVIPEGQPFLVHQKHVRILTATHAAKLAAEPEKKRYKRRDMRAER